MKSFKELEVAINDLATNKWGLMNGSQLSKLAQLAKVSEEFGELERALVDKNTKEILDGFGDVLVTIIISAKQNGIDLLDYHFEEPFDELEYGFSVWHGQLSAAILKGKVTIYHYLDITWYLFQYAKDNNIYMLNALNYVYDIISKRSGKTVNGTFIKD